MNPVTYIARYQLNLALILSFNYGNSRMWRGEGKKLKEDLNEVTSYKGSEDFDTLMKVSSPYILVGHHAALFTLEIITESQIDMGNG